MSDSDNQEDKNTFGRRLSRYTKTTGTMAGLAAKIAGEKWFGMAIERDGHARELMGALGNLKGPLMKVAQILATIPEALPPEYARELQQLQSNAPAMGWPFVKRRMRSELGAEWENKFKDFSKEAAAAASLGQVHKATHHDGTLLACKLQYPDMQSAIEADLRQLKIIFSVYEQYDKSLSTKNIHAELSERLYEELDYDREARHTKLYTHLLKDEAGVHVPTVVDALSTSRLLTTHWLEGEKILTFTEHPQEARNQLALNMFRAWYIPLYKSGVIHGDPHLGNYTVRKDLSINLLDFGCVRIFPPSFVKGVIDLYNALLNNDDSLAVHAYETWGFTGLTKEVIDILNIWARFLYGPILDDKIRAIGHADGAVYGRETARDVHMKLREARAGIPVPREFVFMDRAALGLGSVFIHLDAQINWYELFNSMIEDFDVKVLEKNQAETLKKFDLGVTKKEAA